MLKRVDKLFSSAYTNLANMKENHIHIIRRWLMPLVVAPVGKDVRVVKILADEKTKKHLENLGITIDSVIRVISASGGSVICVVKDGRLALDKEMATKILIA